MGGGRGVVFFSITIFKRCCVVVTLCLESKTVNQKASSNEPNRSKNASSHKDLRKKKLFHSKLVHLAGYTAYRVITTLLHMPPIAFVLILAHPLKCCDIERRKHKQRDGRNKEQCAKTMANVNFKAHPVQNLNPVRKKRFSALKLAYEVRSQAHNDSGVLSLLLVVAPSSSRQRQVASMPNDIITVILIVILCCLRPIACRSNNQLTLHNYKNIKLQNFIRTHMTHGTRTYT